MRRAMLGNEVIDLDRLTKPEIMQLKRRRDFFCEKCGKPVIFKNGTRKKAHFSHLKDGLHGSNPESAGHIMVKHSMARWLGSQGIDATIERRFPMIDRIADVFFEYKNVKYVLEIQKSAMSDVEFKQRILDYLQVGVTVLWIFLGDVEQKENTFKLPPVMLGRGLWRMFHFCVKTTNLRIFEAPVYISTRSVYAKPMCGRLSEFRVDDLLSRRANLLHFDESWLGVKKHFRERGWHYASKSEKKLLEQCLMRGFNLSLLPTEVGWPVDGDFIGKHLFVWQSYVLLTLMKHYRLGDIFTLDQMLRLLEIEYQLVMCDGARMQVLTYLKWLDMFGIIKEDQGYFEYVKLPKISVSMEEKSNRDKKYVEVAVKLWQASWKV